MSDTQKIGGVNLYSRRHQGKVIKFELCQMHSNGPSAVIAIEPEQAETLALAILTALRGKVRP